MHCMSKSHQSFETKTTTTKNIDYAVNVIESTSHDSCICGQFSCPVNDISFYVYKSPLSYALHLNINKQSEGREGGSVSERKKNEIVCYATLHTAHQGGYW